MYAEKRDVLRSRDYFQRENADKTFRTHTILEKGVKTGESLLFRAFKFVSRRIGSKTSKSLHVMRFKIYFKLTPMLREIKGVFWVTA